MTLLQAIILGIIEGLTEFIPVSSTGHLLLANAAMRLDSMAADSFVIVIQLGAILAAAVYYRRRLRQMATEATQKRSGGRRLAVNLLIAFIPAACVGLLAEDFIESRLMRGDHWIALALILGGAVMIGVEYLLPPRERTRDRLEDVTPIDALWVGIAQCFSLWPGMSRSMTTIVGGQLRGFSDSLAADFSFLLAIPTLGAATLYKMVTDREMLLGMEGGWLAVAAGLVVSFVVAWAAIAWFLRILKRVGLTPFGMYRIVIGLLVFWVLWGS